MEESGEEKLAQVVCHTIDVSVHLKDSKSSYHAPLHVDLLTNDCAPVDGTTAEDLLVS